jgi:hypothetical protein
MTTEGIFFVSLFFLVGYVVQIAVTSWSRRQHLKAITAFNTHVLDRLGSATDFGAFAQTEAGSQLMRGLTAVEPPGTTPERRILNSVQTGIVLLSLGLGLLSLARSSSVPGHAELTVVGTIGLSLGVGFLLSAGTSYQLSRALGLLRPPDPRL